MNEAEKTRPHLPGMPKDAPLTHIPNPSDDVKALDELERHLFAHRYAKIGIECYGPSIDPRDAVKDRSEALAILENEDKELICCTATGELLERLASPEAHELLDETHRAQVRVLLHERTKRMNIPDELEADFTRLINQTHAIWCAAKNADDWQSFEPWLDRVVTAVKTRASYINPESDPYDVLLDEHERGTDQTFYNSFFSAVRDELASLFLDIQKSKRHISTSCIEGRFDTERQWRLAHDILKLVGLDEHKVFLSSSEHPYSDALSINYGIIAAHVFENNLISNVYTMLHESGHVLYEQGLDPSYDYTSLKGGTSSGMHEGQSRFFENYIGRSEAFASPLVQLLKKHFPGEFGRVTARQLYLAANCVSAEPLRTDADELSYPLHILIRYEIEQLLLSGEASAKDVPALWKEKYKKYLGITLHDDKSGALQDMHWANGLFGYFPTYALGGAYGAQLMSAIVNDGLDWNGLLSEGNVEPISLWLKKHIWRFGKTKEPRELLRAATGEDLNLAYYTDYLRKKFSAIYGLEG